MITHTYNVSTKEGKAEELLIQSIFGDALRLP